MYVSDKVHNEAITVFVVTCSAFYTYTGIQSTPLESLLEPTVYKYVVNDSTGKNMVS